MFLPVVTAPFLSANTLTLPYTSWSAAANAWQDFSASSKANVANIRSFMAMHSKNDGQQKLTSI
jgi:hypothetical protein